MPVLSYRPCVLLSIASFALSFVLLSRMAALAAKSKSAIKPIKNEADYEAALARVSLLMDAKLNAQETDELDILATLIVYYEDN